MKAPRKGYKLSTQIEPECRHYLVINALSETLEEKGFTIGNDQLRDLYIVQNKKIRMLFEAKADCSRNDLYQAVGQLYLNGSAIDPRPILVAVLPGMPSSETQQVLDKLGVRVVTYVWEDDLPIFTGIKDTLNLL